jgi:hypothetical protein
MAIRRGTLISISAQHYSHKNHKKKHWCAKVSTWGVVHGPRGGEYNVWLGKVNGISGLVVATQEQRVVRSIECLIGKEIQFECHKYRGRCTYFATENLALKHQRRR